MSLLKRKIDGFLEEWKSDPERLPLIVKGARQIGKTESIRYFAKKNYKNFIEINFVLNKEYCDIFNDGFSPDNIIKNISLRNPELEFSEGDTLIFSTNFKHALTVPQVLNFSNRTDGMMLSVPARLWVSIISR